MSDLAALNTFQREAVTSLAKNLLVLAGAGSGKTRVLTHRISWLIQSQGYSPFSILAVTFTNKAAQEMRNRVEQLLNRSIEGMWIGTFHSIAHRFLRLHSAEINLASTFQILDQEDQLRIIKRVLRQFNLDEKKWTPRQAQGYINQKKENGLRARHMLPPSHPTELTLHRIYTAYETLCEQNHLLDFSELLLKTYETLRDSPALLQQYQDRLKHVLVDEFQDTNDLQYAWLRLLNGMDNALTLVGDDDQSIYRWRGAKVENILNFGTHFSEHHIVRLEQNYRSTAIILEAANHIIKHNNARLGKKLWTQHSKGEPICVYSAFNEIDEARFIVSRIQTAYEENYQYGEIAVLYRSNAQSRVLEEALLQKQVPYFIYGGLRFFERAEIKDALAYLRLSVHLDDDAAFERILNTPIRGIGEHTLQVLREQAHLNQVSLRRVTEQLIQTQHFSARILSALQGFINLIVSLNENTQHLALPEHMDYVIQASGLTEYYQKEGGEKSQMRLENLAELVSAAKMFTSDESTLGSKISSVESFLAHAALESTSLSNLSKKNSVQLMTLHAAKGLEFPVVLIAGFEEGLFPHPLALENNAELEEERRLCYVGITRAMKKLYFTYAERRRLHGKERYPTPSRFIKEIPKLLLQQVFANRLAEVRPTPAPVASTAKLQFQLGQKIDHDVFGSGIVLNCEAWGTETRVQIKFERYGTKWIMASYIK